MQSVRSLPIISQAKVNEPKSTVTFLAPQLPRQLMWLIIELLLDLQVGVIIYLLADLPLTCCGLRDLPPLSS